MPATTRRQSARPAVPSATRAAQAAQVAQVWPGQRATQAAGESDDDPLAMTPLKRTRRDRSPPCSSGRKAARSRVSAEVRELQRAADKLVYGGPGGVEDLIPPSDDEEFGVWAALRATQRAEKGKWKERAGSVVDKELSQPGMLRSRRSTRRSSAPTSYARHESPPQPDESQPDAGPSTYDRSPTPETIPIAFAGDSMPLKRLVAFSLFSDDEAGSLGSGQVEDEDEDIAAEVIAKEELTGGDRFQAVLYSGSDRGDVGGLGRLAGGSASSWNEGRKDHLDSKIVPPESDDVATDLEADPLVPSPVDAKITMNRREEGEVSPTGELGGFDFDKMQRPTGQTHIEILMASDADLPQMRIADSPSPEPPPHDLPFASAHSHKSALSSVSCATLNPQPHMDYEDSYAQSPGPRQELVGISPFRASRPSSLPKTPTTPDTQRQLPLARASQPTPSDRPLPTETPAHRQRDRRPPEEEGSPDVLAIISPSIRRPAEHTTRPLKTNPPTSHSPSPVLPGLARHPSSPLTALPALDFGGPETADRTTVPPADPALEQFRSARTFRTRTVLQLQPYTRERQIYEAALRRGGLKKGKHVIAPVKEIRADEEGDEEEAQSDPSLEAETEAPDAIVIGGLLPRAAVQKTALREPLVDADYDEFFLQFGKAADKEDEMDIRRLQKIARCRLRTAKKERRRRKEAERAKRAFERLMRDRERAERESEEGREHLMNPQPKRRRVTQSKTSGQPTTYGRTARGHSHKVMFSSDSEDLPELPSPLPPPRHSAPEMSGITSAEPSLRLPLSSLDDGNVDFEEGYRNGSFFVDDIPPPVFHRPESSGKSSSDESDAAQRLDKRAKIARRMLPAAMLKKLEREAAEQARRKEERKRKEARRTTSPLKPGRAVVKRTGANVAFDEIVDLVASQESEESEGTAQLWPHPSPRLTSEQTPIIISDDSDSSSQAEEYNGPETLARLYEGDYESIVAGPRRVSRPDVLGQKKLHSSRLDHRHRTRRPALRLTERARAPLSEVNRAFVQTKLDFQVQERRSARSAKKRKSKTGDYHTISASRRRAPRPRPAIRLEDHVIFATADFAFDSDKSSRPVAKRSSARTTSKSSPEAEHVDSGVGKARSWANFAKFPIDFDISPLPLGLYCDPNSAVGSGRLSRLVGFLRKDQRISTRLPEPCSAYNVEFWPNMTADAMVSVLPIYFDGLHQAMLNLTNDGTAEALKLQPFDFLASFLPLHTSTGFRSDIRQEIFNLAFKLDNIAVSSSKRDVRSRDSLLTLRWHILELMCWIDRDAPTGDESVMGDRLGMEVCATSLVRDLLASGFDKSIRPLKRILRGESDTAEVKETTTILWIALIHALDAWDAKAAAGGQGTILASLVSVLDECFQLDKTGPMAAERVWFIVFGLCALSQFSLDGRIDASFTPSPRWSLIRRAVGLIRISHNEEAEERAGVDQLQGRDRYIKVMMARCVRLSAVWKWSFDRESFTVATKDLGVIFKDRQHRNLPTEPPVDFPDWITSFNMSLTAAEDTKRESAFELYLRLVCVAASDIITNAESLTAAQQAEKDVQRLIMSIIPVSPVKFNRVFPPDPRQLGQLVNRYSTMVAACYFSPSLLPWLLAISKKWAPFELADFESRQISVRGIMYLAVACRHHQYPLDRVVSRLADVLSTLQGELDTAARQVRRMQLSSKVEVQRSMVLVVTCFRQIILHHSFDVEQQQKPAYPDPCLLHESWTSRIFELSTQDHRSGLEIVGTIQAFLDARAAALPRKARQARDERLESQDEFGSLGFELDSITIAGLGGDARAEVDPVERQDEEFAQIVENVICPRIYRLLSDLLPAVADDKPQAATDERELFIRRLTKCWSDCAAVIVIEHRRLDWSTFIGPFGKQSWSRLGEDAGRTQVGLHFMLNVAQLDPGSFSKYAEDFAAVLFQTIVTDKITVEHKYLSAVLSMPGALAYPLFEGVEEVHRFNRDHELDRGSFLDARGPILEVLFGNISRLLGSKGDWADTRKPFIYRCINLLVSALVSNEQVRGAPYSTSTFSLTIT